MKKRKNSSEPVAMMNKGPEAATSAAKVAPPPPPQPPAVKAGEVEANNWMVDEQMWWGGQWFPSWDVQVMGEAYISSLYSDVWDGYDDDIWGFRNSDHHLLPTTRPTQ